MKSNESYSLYVSPHPSPPTQRGWLQLGYISKPDHNNDFNNKYFHYVFISVFVCLPFIGTGMLQHVLPVVPDNQMWLL